MVRDPGDRHGQPVNTLLAGRAGGPLRPLIAEIGGVALALRLVSSVHHVLIVPFVAFVVWLILWRARFSIMGNVLGLFGLALVVFAVARVDWEGGVIRLRSTKLRNLRPA